MDQEPAGTQVASAGLLDVAQASIGFSNTAPALVAIAEQANALSRSLEQDATLLSQDVGSVRGAFGTIRSLASESEALSQTVKAAAQEVRDTGTTVSSQVAAIGEAATTLGSRLQQLHQLSQEIANATSLIAEIADQTRMLAINAHIQAAHAGDAGRGFQVIASEIRRLAEQAGGSSDRIRDLLNGIQDVSQQSIVGMQTVEERTNHTAEASRLSESSVMRAIQAISGLVEKVHAMDQTAKGESGNVDRIAEGAGSLVQAAHQQAQMGLRLGTSADEIRNNADRLLLSIGKFRFEAQSTAQQTLETTLRSWNLRSLDAQSMDPLLSGLVQQNPSIELAYVVNHRGLQISSNVSPSGKDPSVKGKNWSVKPWFREPVQRKAAWISDIYRSVATDSYCFTVAIPLMDNNASLLGVFAADLRFSSILDSLRT